jgi:serralysin
VLIGGLGGDVLEGGSGVNTASYANATSFVLAHLQYPAYNLGEAVGDSYIGIQNLAGSRFNDVLYGNESANRLTGGLGNDLLVGAGGADVLDGGVGTDIAGYDASFTTTLRADMLLPSTNTNAAVGDVYISIENLNGSSFNDTLLGNNLANVISGSGYPNSASGNDQLFGRGGNDVLRGYDGADRLYGGAGIDRLEGGAGADVFAFDTALNAATNRDAVIDFVHAQDKLWLENAIFTKLGAGVHALNPAFFHAGAAAADANDYIVYNHATGALSYDANGNAAGGAVVFAVLTNHPVLAASDFLVI